MNQVKKFGKPALVLLAIICISLIGSRAMADMLTDEISAALDSHPEIASLKFGAAAAQKQIKQAYSLYLPSLDARAAAGRENIDNPSTQARLDGDDNLGPTELSITLRQNIFEGFGTRSAVESAAAGHQAATMSVLDGGERVGLQAVQAYINLLRYQKLVGLAKRNLDTHKGLLRLIQQRVRQKVGSASEINQTMARIKEAEAEVYQAQGGLENARSVYKTVMGADPAETLEEPDIPIPASAAGLDELIDEGVKENPVILRAQVQVERAEAEARRLKAAFWPTLDLELTANHDNDLSGTPGRYEGYKAMTVMTYNIYSGGLDQSRKREALLLVRQAKSDLEFAKRTVTEQIRVSHNDLRVSRLRLKSFQAQVKENKRVQKAFADQFKVGKRTLLDLLDTQRELFRSESNVVSEGHEEMFGIYRLIVAQGRLLNTLGISAPKGVEGE